MRSMKRVGLGLALAGLWAMSASPMLAAEDGTVDAQVTVATPCVLVSPGTLDFGTLPFSFAGNPGTAQKAIDVQNCGGSGERLFARGTDASYNGSTIWTIGLDNTCLDGVNHYALQAYKSSSQIAVDLTTSDQPIDIVGAGSSSVYDALILIMPCSGSDGAGQVVTFSAIFTATF